MSVSVVISTYNGEQNIIDQLESIKNQSYKIDEVLICDDCSTDDTYFLIENYINKHRLINWSLTRNSINKGWKINFFDLICKASGEYIFPCDQDDIWQCNKVRDMVKTAKERNALLLASDYKPIYENKSVKLPRTKISRIKYNNSVEKINNIKALLLVDRPGCTFCINFQLLQVMKKLWFEDYPHDALAWRCAMLKDSLYILHRPMILFRRHGNNASDYKNRKSNDRVKVANYYLRFLKDIINQEDLLLDTHRKKFVQKAIEVQQRRIKNFERKNIFSAIISIKDLFYYPTVNTYYADIYSVIKSRKQSE